MVKAFIFVSHNCSDLYGSHVNETDQVFDMKCGLIDMHQHCDEIFGEMVCCLAASQLTDEEVSPPLSTRKIAQFNIRRNEHKKLM